MSNVGAGAIRNECPADTLGAEGRGSTVASDAVRTTANEAPIEVRTGTERAAPDDVPTGTRHVGLSRTRSRRHFTRYQRGQRQCSKAARRRQHGNHHFVLIVRGGGAKAFSQERREVSMPAKGSSSTYKVHKYTAS